ncbi:hypothetical protein JD844_013730 [Phrynosoma platyrhinos]|uniref:SCAN box domain-containing protein n=1 Tax=Phrynosoma platyrhinos TaxID=52577 RepID=A0ABQ7TLZ3_PHRPL|nr:hypothetical protein JD844_013730 [Phrynosoma platyrhinos]
METLRKHFRQFRYQAVEDPRRIYGQLQELCHQWLKPERRSKEQILELLVLEQFLAILPQDLQNQIRSWDPETGTETVSMEEVPMNPTKAEGTPQREIYTEAKEKVEDLCLLGGFVIPKPEAVSQMEQGEMVFIRDSEECEAFPSNMSGEETAVFAEVGVTEQFTPGKGEMMKKPLRSRRMVSKKVQSLRKYTACPWKYLKGRLLWLLRFTNKDVTLMDHGGRSRWRGGTKPQKWP